MLIVLRDLVWNEGSGLHGLLEEFLNRHKCYEIGQIVAPIQLFQQGLIFSLKPQSICPGRSSILGIILSKESGGTIILYSWYFLLEKVLSVIKGDIKHLDIISVLQSVISQIFRQSNL